MKKILLVMVLSLFVMAGVAEAKQTKITFGWDPNTESDLAWYKLYKSNVSGGQVLESNGGIADTVIPAGTEQGFINLPDGDWYIVFTAGDTSNNESLPSAELHEVTNANPPGAGSGFHIITREVVED